MKKLILLAAGLLGLASTGQAILYTTNWSNALNPGSPFANGGVIPDANLSGWADTRTWSTMPSGSIVSVAVSLELSGGWNGDLYAYLVHGSGFAVLLDRVGPGPNGYSDPGMNVILANPGALTTAGPAPTQNIDVYRDYSGLGAPGGVWNPNNLAGLSSFTNTMPGGTWTLFLADLSGGDITTVQSWGLQMDIVAVPEVEAWVAAALAGAFGAFWLNRQIWSGVKSRPGGEAQG